MLRFMNRANALTVFGLMSALFGALLAVQGKLHFAMVALVVAGLADLFDGPLARTIERSDEEKLFGQPAPWRDGYTPGSSRSLENLLSC